MYEMKFGRLVFPMWNHSFCAGQCASWILKGLNRGRMVDTQKDHLFDGRDSLMRAIHAGGPSPIFLEKFGLEITTKVPPQTMGQTKFLDVLGVIKQHEGYTYFTIKGQLKHVMAFRVTPTNCYFFEPEEGLYEFSGSGQMAVGVGRYLTDKAPGTTECKIYPVRLRTDATKGRLAWKSARPTGTR